MSSPAATFDAVPSLSGYLQSLYERCTNDIFKELEGWLTARSTANRPKENDVMQNMSHTRPERVYSKCVLKDASEKLKMLED
jgi:hypothetical protein